jgi:choline dehydrogenase-like flavoprotein
MDSSPLSSAIQATTFDVAQDRSAFDAIIVGAGAAGGLAAALLTEAGMRVLVLDAGYRKPFWAAPVQRSIGLALGAIADPRLLGILPHGLVWRGEKALRLLGRMRQPVQSRCYAWLTAPDLFVDDIDNPYETPPGQPFQWIRARGLGGRMVVPVHGRQYLRHGARDFRPVDGLSPAWPFEPDALEPWYALVEQRLGLSGGREGSPWVPDSLVAEERTADAAEAELMALVRDRYPAITPILGRYAPPMPTLEAAAATGRLNCRTGAICSHVELGASGRAESVVFHDVATDRRGSASAPHILLAASCLESTRILLASRSDRTPGGIGARSGALGRFLMDHVSIKVEGIGKTIETDSRAGEVGRCVYLPRFEARNDRAVGQGRGYGVRVYRSPGPPGKSYFTAIADAEMLPREDNVVTLSDRRDAWGMPTLRIRASHSPAEQQLASDQAAALRELSGLLGVDITNISTGSGTPGAAIHECGTARIGDDPAASVVDPFNQCWDAPGLYVIDGAAFPSEGIQNPTLTIMALTARACDAISRSG